jgi:histidinol-phosphate phosphatase family protein
VKRRPAVFLDRDGAIIEDRGHLARVEDVVLYPGAPEALRRLQERFLLFIVTNQPGVAQGLIRMEDVDLVNAYLVAQLRELGVQIAAVYVCPHRRADGCECIKPKRYFPDRAAAEHGADLARSISLGDHLHDVELAEATGGRGVFLLTGHGARHAAELPPGTVVVPGIGEAAEWALRNVE